MISKTKIKEFQRKCRHKRIRKKVFGTSERPRLCVHRSSRNLFAHVVDDTSNKILIGMSTLSKDIKKKFKNGGNIEAAMVLGEVFADKVKAKGIEKVCFDRGGYLFHGRVKAFAEAARKKGLNF